MVDVVLLLYLPQRFGTKCVGWRFNSSRRLQLFPLFYQLVTAKSSISGQRLSCADVSKFFPLACFFGGFDAAHTQVHFSLHSPLAARGESPAGSRCERRGPACKARRSRRCRIIVEEALHRRRAHADATQRAPGVCGRWTALLVIADVQASSPPGALPATADPWRATLRDFHHGLLDAIGEGEALRTPRCEACPPMPPPTPPWRVPTFS